MDANNTILASTESMAFADAVVDATGLVRLQIAPWGTVEGKSGTFVIDRKSAGLIIAEFDAHGASLPIDVEHETLTGRPAPAVGWIRKVFVEEGRGLFGLVEWNDEGRKLVRSKAYRYVSPVFMVNKDDRRAVVLHSVALTTKPAIPQRGIETLAASQRSQDTEVLAMVDGTDTAGLLREIATMLGMENATDTDAILRAVLQALNDRKDNTEGDSEDKEIASAVRTRLGLVGGASKAEIILAMSTTTDVDAGRELSSMRESEKERSAKARVDHYVAANVLNPKDTLAMESALWLAAEHPERFEAMMSNATPYANVGRSTPPGGRATVVAQANSTYRSDPDLQKTASAIAHANQRLRDGGLSSMSDDEAREWCPGGG